MTDEAKSAGEDADGAAASEDATQAGATGPETAEDTTGGTAGDDAGATGATGPEAEAGADQVDAEDDGKDARIAELEAQVAAAAETVTEAQAAVADRDSAIAELQDELEKATEAAQAAAAASTGEGDDGLTKSVAALYKTAGQGRPGVPVVFANTGRTIVSVGLSHEAWRDFGSPEAITATVTAGSNVAGA